MAIGYVAADGNHVLRVTYHYSDRASETMKYPIVAWLNPPMTEALTPVVWDPDTPSARAQPWSKVKQGWEENGWEVTEVKYVRA